MNPTVQVSTSVDIQIEALVCQDVLDLPLGVNEYHGAQRMAYGLWNPQHHPPASSYNAQDTFSVLLSCSHTPSCLSQDGVMHCPLCATPPCNL